MKDFLKKLTILGCVIALLGIVVLISGIVPIKASSGHWAITKWILDFASDRSVSTNSLGTAVPPLDEDGMMELGAGIYQSNCQWCHGRPGYPLPPVAAGMTPSPPFLPDALGKWETRHKFYIVKHGIKFAGMPAWPTQKRDDEIWPLVAFLEELEHMTPDEYHKMLTIDPSPDAPRIVNESCAACHRIDGTGIAGNRVPILAGQNEVYLRDTLQAYANGNRDSGVMQPIAARLSEQQWQEAATWYAAQPSDPTPGTRSGKNGSDTEAIDAGRRLAVSDATNREIARCLKCHGSNNDPAYPVLAGQPADFLNQQLRLFRNRKRGGTDRSNLMHKIADSITEQQSQQLAAYFSSLAPEDPSSRNQPGTQ